uniref:cytochrome c biogenesis protein ResB n=1 Tax=Candidatus Ulvibacter alkanivorans TaxID=2267620 RepID=UPI00109D0057
MKNLLTKVKKILYPLFNTRAAGLYFILFAAAIAIATFIENDFGTSAAQKVIFKAWWFELLLALFGITIIVNIFTYRMIQQKKWALLLFHASIIVILIGAGVTRYFGFEGVMHIRENDAANTFLSAETYLKFEANKDGTTYNFSEPVLFASLGDNSWEESYLIGDDLVHIEVSEFLPNPKQSLVTDEAKGLPTLKIVVAGPNGREEYYISQGETKRIRNVTYNFKQSRLPGAINLVYQNDELAFTTSQTLTQRVMATQQLDTIQASSDLQPLKLRALYSDGSNNFVFSEFNPYATIAIVSEKPKVENQSTVALQMDVTVNETTKQTYIYGNKGLPGRPSTLIFDDLSLQLSYGAKEISVPF